MIDIMRIMEGRPLTVMIIGSFTEEEEAAPDAVSPDNP
jgi:hypothetical protein